MSLVNDMLKALEQRDGLTQESDGQCDYFQNLETNRASEGSNAKQWWLSLFIALVVGAAASGYWVFSSPQTKTQVAVGVGVQEQTTVTATPVTTRTVTATQGKKVAQVATVEPKPEPETETATQAANVITLLPVAPTTAIEKGVDERIAPLLHEAELALLNNRLTDPVEDNAYARYQSVLLLDPSHEQALAGIQAIVERYVEFSRQTGGRGEITKANAYWRKAQAIAKQYPSIQYWLAMQEIPFSKSQQLAAAAPETIQMQSPRTDTVTNKPAPELRVQPSCTYRDEQVSNQAKTLIAEQRWREAEQLLVEVLGVNPAFEKSRKVLFDLYVQQQNTNAAQQLLRQWPSISVSQRSLLQARLAVQNQEWQGALAVLEQNLAGVNNDEEYLALLAAVYHQLGDYGNAAAQYQRLVEINKHNSAYWLGLAVSYDALADKSAALRAFRFARLYGGLDDNTFAYVEQRISALTTATNAG